MTYSDAIIKRLTDLCVERGIPTELLDFPEMNEMEFEDE